MGRYPDRDTRRSRTAILRGHVEGLMVARHAASLPFNDTQALAGYLLDDLDVARAALEDWLHRTGWVRRSTVEMCACGSSFLKLDKRQYACSRNCNRRLRYAQKTKHRKAA